MEGGLSLTTSTILLGDVFEQLATLPDASVHCVVTSPPYWGLRDYGTGRWDGGDPNCPHSYKAGGTNASTLGDYNNVLTAAAIERKVMEYGHATYRSECKKCGARRVDRQIGLEESAAEYIDKMVAVFRDVRRVLRDDGTCWVNIGDSYAGKAGGGQGATGQRATRTFTATTITKRGSDIKPKDLVGIPWLLAFALRADGWHLRSEVIWHKPNPMPESVSDRPTTAHERIFLLTKSPDYYYDADAIKEPVSGTAHSRGKGLHPKCDDGSAPIRARANTSFSAAVRDLVSERNKRSVWTVPSQSYSGAHFATFPPRLIEPCILAGCPVGGTVLDPFAGSGTTACVAREHGRNAVLIELNPSYATLARERIARHLMPLGLATGSDLDAAGLSGQIGLLA